MIYRYLPAWMEKENPAFVRAVTSYYSFEHGKLNNAAFGELGFCIRAEHQLRRCPNPPRKALKLRWIRERNAKDQEARRKKDHRYFRRMADALQLLEKGEHQWSPVEFVFNAYAYLRKRAGEGSPLPSKGEVKRMAALFWAFSDCGLQEKLPEYLWENAKLTERQFTQIRRHQERHLRVETARDWARYLKEVGLSGLQQRQNGGMRR
jgi:hypothetical protein